MDCVNKAISLGFLGQMAAIIRVTEEARRHARPEGEDDKGEQVAHGHGAPPSFIQGRASGQRVGAKTARSWMSAVARRGEVEEDDEEEDGAGDVDKGVETVGPAQERRALQKPGLQRQLPEEVEPLFEMDQLQGMLAGNVDCGVDEREGREGSAELVNLAALCPPGNDAWLAALGR